MIGGTCQTILDIDNPHVVARYACYQTNLYKYGPNIK